MTTKTKQLTPQFLVLTAIGENKTGLVSELSGLVNQCNCNVVDSKMAIFGNEFSMIMLLQGDSASLVQLEMQLPPLAMQLNLLTMMKRTSKHSGLEKPQYLLVLDGPDRAGTIKMLTSMLAKQKVDISSLKSRTKIKDGKDWQVAEICIDLPESITLEQLEKDVNNALDGFHMNCQFHPITIET